MKPSNLKLAVLKLAGIGGNGRNIRTRPGDCFLVGYPKSGNTWLNFLVASLIAESVREVDFKSINRLVGDVHALTPLQLHRMPTPRFLKSHDYFCERFPKVVHISRNPYSVAVSYYYFLMKRRRFDESYLLSEFVRDWIKGQWGPGYGTWETHNQSWYNLAQPETAHFLKYEDLKANTYEELRKIAKHLEIATSPSRIRAAIDWCSAENMARLEKDGMYEGFKGLQGSRDDIAFVRTGKKDDRQVLTEQDKALISDTWGNMMRRLGYL